MLHVPQIGLLVAGDVVYNGVHLYLTESGGLSGIDAWLAALDIAEALRPATIIAGHKDPHAQDDPSQIQATRSYLTDARRLLATLGNRRGVLPRHARAAPLPTEPRRALGWCTSTVPVDVTSRRTSVALMRPCCLTSMTSARSTPINSRCSARYLSASLTGAAAS
jgi:hypothetical protein